MSTLDGHYQFALDVTYYFLEMVFLPILFFIDIRCSTAVWLLVAFLLFHSFRLSFIVFTVGFLVHRSRLHVQLICVCVCVCEWVCVLAYFLGMVIVTSRSCILNHQKSRDIQLNGLWLLELGVRALAHNRQVHVWMCIRMAGCLHFSQNVCFRMTRPY